MFGQQIEHIVAKYLQKQGLELLTTNFSCTGGELDLVMRDGITLVFIEVRYRKNNDFGGALASVNRAKQRKIQLAANYYLQTHPEYKFLPCRYDICAVTGAAPYQIDWIKDAFWEHW